MSHTSKLKLSCLAVVCASLAACASVPEGQKSPADPLQSYNRGMSKFNDNFNNAFTRPITKMYTRSVPEEGRKSVGNFFNNLATVPAILNDLLQFNFNYMFKDMTRLLVNTTLGLGGLFDVAAQNGIYRHPQSFDYTLAKWGWTQSSYFVIPVLGPSTVSGAISKVPDYYANPIAHVDSNAIKYSATGLNAIQTASEVLPRQKTLAAMSLDPYIALRDAYLQNRTYNIGLIQKDGSVTAESIANAPPKVA